METASLSGDTTAELQEYWTILEAYTEYDTTFFVITIIHAFLVAICLIGMIIQLCKQPAGDVYVLKGTIYLCMGATGRIVCSAIIFFFWASSKHNFKKPLVFGVFVTELSLSLPLFFFLMAMFSFLFSTYRLYLIIQEMLGLSVPAKTDEENGSVADSTGGNVNEGEQESFLDKLSNKGKETQIFFSSSLKNRKNVRIVSVSIDIWIFASIVIKLVCAIIGTRQALQSKLSSVTQKTYYVTTILAQVMEVVAFFLSLYILYKVRKVLNRRPVCQTDLCEEELSQEEKQSQQQQSPSFEIQEANNTAVEGGKLSPSAAAIDEKFKGYCFLCQAIKKTAVQIRMKFTFLILALWLFQIIFEWIYWACQKEFILKQNKNPELVTTGALYALYCLEIVVLSSLVYARYQQAKTTEEGKELLTSSKRKSDAEVIKRKTQMGNIFKNQDSSFDLDQDDDQIKQSDLESANQMQQSDSAQVRAQSHAAMLKKQGILLSDGENSSEGSSEASQDSDEGEQASQNKQRSAKSTPRQDLNGIESESPSQNSRDQIRVAETIHNMKNKQNKDLFLLQKSFQGSIVSQDRSSFARRETVQEVDFRNEQQRAQDEPMSYRPKMAINSDTEEEDSSDDEATAAAKRALLARTNIRSSIKDQANDESESDY